MTGTFFGCLTAFDLLHQIMSIEDHNAHQAILNDSGQSLFGTGSEDSVYSLNDTHNLICRFYVP